MARKRKRKKYVNEGDLSPAVAAGLTQGASAKEALEQFPVSSAPSGVQVVAHMATADARLERGRDQFAQFVAADSFDAVWSDGVTDRPQMDVHKTYTKQGMRLLREGRQCLRCDEPHPEPFPLECDFCGYPMKDRQIMDVAMEFEGEKHLGPSRPIAEYLEDQELRVEKRKFIAKKLAGGSQKIPSAWLRDAHLFPDGVPEALL